MEKDKFQYEWYTIRIQYTVGWFSTEFKAKNKELAIKKINKELKNWSLSESRLEEFKIKIKEVGNSDVDQLAKSFGMPKYSPSKIIISVDWDSLTLDRVGYQRLF